MLSTVYSCRWWRALGALLAIVWLPVPVAATTIVARSDAALVALSDRVIRGRVIGIRAEPLPGGGVRTMTRVAVLEDLTGRGDPIVDVTELGGEVAGRGMWVPGAPRFALGQHVLLCLEAAHGGWRTVAMAYSAFTVDADAATGEARLDRFAGSYALVGDASASAIAGRRSLRSFRETVARVKGVAAVEPLGEAEAAAMIAAAEPAPLARVDEAFSLLGGGIRWRGVDSGQAVAWYRNASYPSPLVGADVDQQMQVAMQAWTAPANARVVLTYAGTRGAPIASTNDYCSSANDGVGLITFGDPANAIPSGTLAIGGGCYSFETSVASGHTFNSFTNGYVVFNDGASISGYTTVPNFTRVLTHEVGHGIGLGHNPTDTSALMYPSCCASSSPVPPALGTDDVAGVAFIYPGNEPPPCTFTLAPAEATFTAAGGNATLTLTASAPTCAWTAASDASWVTFTGASTGTGSNTIGIQVEAQSAQGDRDAVVTVAGQTTRVRQTGAACSYTVAPPPPTLLPASGTLLILNVTPSFASCAWTASSTVSWITLVSPVPVTGAGSVQLRVDANITGGARTGQATVADTTLSLPQASDTDTDGDTLSDAWELQFGLSNTDGQGSQGPDGDPDADGLTNRQELAAGTHPRGFFTRYLAEGAVNAFFNTELAFFSYPDMVARIHVRIQPEGQAERAVTLGTPFAARRTLTSTHLATLTTAPFSTVVESDQPVIVDRTMSWDATGYGAHAETAGAAPATTWYLAEGSTSGDFALFYLLQNPQPSSVTATVRFLRPAPSPPVERVYTLPPQSRTTVPIDTAAPELASTDVSAVVTATLPIMVERAMYLSRPGQPFAAGHASAGVTTPATEWFLAEGATGTFFELFVLIANPGSTPAAVTVDYLLPDGSTVSKSYAVAGNSRYTIWVDDEQFPAGSGNRRLANVSVAMRVRSTNGIPIVVERAMWWPQPSWYEAHHAPGLTATGTRWALAAGEVGGAAGAETYVLIANTSAYAGQARVTVFFEQTGEAFTRTLDLAANSRTNVAMRSVFPETVGRRFATLVESLGATPAQLAVERAMYTNPGGVLWGAGTAAVATRITP